MREAIEELMAADKLAHEHRSLMEPSASLKVRLALVAGRRPLHVLAGCVCVACRGTQRRVVVVVAQEWRAQILNSRSAHRRQMRRLQRFAAINILRTRALFKATGRWVGTLLLCSHRGRGGPLGPLLSKYVAVCGCGTCVREGGWVRAIHRSVTCALGCFTGSSLRNTRSGWNRLVGLHRDMTPSSHSARPA